MKGKRILLCSVLAAACFCEWGHAQLYNRAPDTLPGLLPEMNEPAYWIARMENHDQVILTVEQIMRKNEAYLERMKSPDRFKGVDPDRLPNNNDLNRWPGRFIVLPDVDGMSAAELAAFIRREIGNDVKYMRGGYGQEILGLKGSTGQQFANILGIEYAD
ncbi:hypothetical protein ACFL55_01770, partial [Candidatus Latescibacterota bacterium]